MRVARVVEGGHQHRINLVGEREIVRGGKCKGNIRGYKEVVSEGEVERE